MDYITDVFSEDVKKFTYKKILRAQDRKMGGDMHIWKENRFVMYVRGKSK